MTPFFLDTSAIFKRYQIEKGSEKVNKIFNLSDSKIFISSLSIIEVISNLKRLTEIDKITTSQQFTMQRNQFYKDILDFEINVIDLLPKHIITAEHLILKRFMKPVDSIQLAIVLGLESDNVIFVCADKTLCNIASRENIKVLNPED